MAQTAEYWRDQIVSQIQADATLAPLLTSGSVFAVFYRLAYAIGFVASVIDQLMDTLRTNIDDDLNAMMAHQIVWYRTKALLFMYGYSLPQYGDAYDLTGLDQATIDAARVVKYCAVSEDVNGKLYVKVAGDDGVGGRIPISGPQLTSFKDYMNRIKDAGVAIVFINETGDLIDITATVYFDPELMNPDGSLIAVGSFPVTDAINAYLNDLPFNGELILAQLEDALQGAIGVTVPSLTDVEVKPVTSASFAPVVIRYLPYSGYFNIDTLTITYIPEP